MTLEDWRDADETTVRALYAAEQARWSAELDWDTAPLWPVIEEGRRLGHVLGWIHRSRSGLPTAWAYYLLHDGELQIGGLTGHRAVDVRALLDRILESPEAAFAQSITGFLYPVPSSVVSAFARRRFAARRSLYLACDLSGSDAGVTPLAEGFRLRPFGDRDVFPAARLLAAAYDGVPGAECFASRGRLEDWARYVRQLVDTPACGRLWPDASLVVDRPGELGLDGVILTTRLSPATSHVAQVAVSQAARGQRIGATLLARALNTARNAGDARVTLMVDEENLAARRLYANVGFEPRSSFLYVRRRGQVRASLVTPAGRRVS